MNNVILDVIIGIIFIFLLYSLLATSIQEAIATGFSIRARMLRSSIIIGMLSNTSADSRWQSILKGTICFFENIWYILIRKPQPKKTGLGQLFYAHPLIKNYGSSRVFPNPSYLPTANFSTVLIDILLSEYDQKADLIAALKAGADAGAENSKPATQPTLSDAQKIQELLSYYGSIYKEQSGGNSTSIISGAAGAVLNIERDTWQILNLHFRTSLNNMETFALKLQVWFDDSMERVAGWYKRQVQVILFIIGLTLAILFNLDIIQIAGKLSTDKDARDQLVKMAVNQADSYKDDPRLKTGVKTDSLNKENADSIFKQYHQHIEEAKNIVSSSITPANKLLALGWGDYGASRDSIKILTKYYNRSKICNQGIAAQKKACLLFNKSQLDSVFAAHATGYKISYIGSSLLDASKFAGILLTAFAISLGAPFWFDLLNKLMKLRASGKKQGRAISKGSHLETTKPVVINVASSHADEEVAG